MKVLIDIPQETFKATYVCKNMLPQQIDFIEPQES